MHTFLQPVLPHPIFLCVQAVAYFARPMTTILYEDFQQDAVGSVGAAASFLGLPGRHLIAPSQVIASMASNATQCSLLPFGFQRKCVLAIVAKKSALPEDWLRRYAIHDLQLR
jgi:hypothetical protein